MAESSPTSEAKKLKMASIRDRLKPDTLLKISFDNDGDDKNEQAPRFLVAYWSIRGLGAPIRAMLHAAQVNHEVALYDLTDAPDADSGFEMKSYAADKKWLREEYNGFMNLPFLIDSSSNLVIAQTNAIFNHLGRELNMMGNKDDVAEQAKIDEMLCEVMDLRNKLIQFSYHSDGSKDEALELWNRAKAHFHKFEAHLAKQYPDYFQKMQPKEENGPKKKTSEQAKEGIAHLIPGSFTAPDFHLWEMLDQYEGLCRTFGIPLWAKEGKEQTTAVNFQSRPDVKPEDRLFPHLEEFRNSFMMLPELANYADSYLHKEIPLNNCMAKFASCYQDFRQYQRGQEAPWRAKGVVEIRYKKV
ncbi:S-transferase Mu [Seminavis robusta]|uniref:glutathione transferase n=1 Tax=Seminavis robusta TaxID=568900 RepID=A0A9N8ENW2_9STRA|nr:S-transferase Mu [Seminavis robusta]|eukprot:Sro1453_g274050.1 S-transferase Mu (357) ;mRNA; r:26246-27316